MSFKEDDYEILLYFNFHILLVDEKIDMIKFWKLMTIFKISTSM